MEENKKDIYANALSLNSTGFEFSIDFSKDVLMLNGLGEHIKTSKSVVSVRMSPQFAKLLLNSLMIQIEDYEQNFGPIPNITQPPARK